MSRHRSQNTWRRATAIECANRVTLAPRISPAPAIGIVLDRGMNKLETAYAAYLDLRQHAGEITWWAYEAITFRLAERTFYTPDFAVRAADAVLEIHETKGFWEEDARAKIKFAASLFPFRFFGVKRGGRRDPQLWLIETFKA